MKPIARPTSAAPIRCSVYDIPGAPICERNDPTGIGLGWIEIVVGGVSYRICPWHRAIGSRLELVADFKLTKALDTTNVQALMAQSLHGSLVEPNKTSKSRRRSPSTRE